MKSGVNFNKAIETATIQFGAFFPTVEESEKHVRSLAEFAAKTPFQLPGIIEASRLLKTFESDAAFGSDTLRVLGDAAAGVNAPLENVALWVGRMNTALDAGRPVGEAATRLQELGLLSGKARVELETLAKAGGSTKDVMGLLRAEWEKHEGAMVTMSESTKGLESTFFDLAAQVAGAAVSVTGLGTAYKTALEGMNAAMSGILLEGTPRLISQIETLNALIDDPRVSGRRLERYKRELIEAEAKLAALTDTTEDAVIATEDWHAGIGGLATEIPTVAGAIGTLHEPGTLTGNTQAFLETVKEIPMYVGKSIEDIGRLGAVGGVFASSGAGAGTVFGDAFLRSLDGKLTTELPRIVGGTSVLQTFEQSGLQSAEGFSSSFQTYGGWSRIMDGASAALGAFATGGWQSGIMSMVQTAVTYLPPGFKEAAQIAIGMYTTLWETFKNPSEAELRARQDVADYQEAAIEGLSDDQIVEAMSAGWTAWEDAAFLITIRDQYAAVGLSAEQAERDVQAYWDAIHSGDIEAIDAQQEAWDEVGVSATQAASAASAAWDSVARAAINAYDKAKAAGVTAYDEVYAAAIEAGLGQEEAAASAAAAQIAATAEVLAAEGQKYARIAAFDAAMALGVNATAEERAEAARLAAAAAIESWDAAMIAVTESDAAANAAITGEAAVTSDVIVDELEDAEIGVGVAFDGMVADSETAASGIQAAFNGIRINIPINYSDNRPAGQMEHRAAGGPVEAMRPYVVGERGPEVIVPTQSGTVVPNDALGGGAPQTIRIELSRTAFTRAVLEDTGRVINVDGVL